MIPRCASVLLVVLVLGSALIPACSDRVETPTMMPDSTLVYAGKSADDVWATITFASRNKVSKRTGERRGVRTTFDLKEGAKVYAFADIQNRFARGDDSLSFHLVWLKPSGKTVFKKRIEYLPSNTDTTLTTSMSISPGRRRPGEYKLQVYLFRELIAEKGFHLRGEIGGDDEGDEDEESM